MKKKKKKFLLCLPSNINGEVMVTFRLVFRVSKVQQYSDSFIQDFLRAGFSAVMHGKPLEVPEFGQINAIVLLGRYHKSGFIWPYIWPPETPTDLSVAPLWQVLVGSHFLSLATK